MDSFDPEDSLVGRLLDGRYRIERIVGVGGMGAVYQATHEVLGSAVAVKVMRSSEPHAAERFLAEARRTFRLDHPNCVQVTDAGVSDSLLYLVMELLEGRTLGEEFDNDGRIEPTRAAHIGAQVADALHCAHQLGYVHRDIKPENIMLLHRGGDPDFAKVLDFGLAKLTDEAKLLGGNSIMSFTRNGMVFGTPHYMSPEQAQGMSLDPRSDLYSLGAVLYEALAGGPPFEGESDVDILISHVQRTPPPLRDYCDLPNDLEQAIGELLEKRPDRRQASALVVARQLKAIASGKAKPKTARRAGVASSETLALPPMFSQPTVETPARRGTKRALLVTAALGIVVAAALASWVFNRTSNNRTENDATAPATAAPVADGGIAAIAEGTAPDAATIDARAADAAAKNSVGPTAAQRKAETLFRKASAAMRAGKGELSYLPLLQAAYKSDRRNRQIRRALVKALLGSSGKAQRVEGCRMIRRDAKHYKREGCAASAGD